MAGLPLVGDEFAGYRVRAVLGRGGMSVVYQAENLRLSSIIALKVLAPELASDDVFRARFLEESRIAASLNHPNVIPIYDMGSQDELLYIAMRYVSGTDLRQIIKEARPPAAGNRAVPAGPGRAGAGHRAPPGPGAPRRETGKPADRAGHRRGRSGSRLPGGLRDHQARHVADGADLDRPVPGHGRLRGDEADPGPAGGGPGRPVLAGLRAVRMPDRAGPLREGPGRGDHLGARRGDAHDADGTPSGTAAGDRRCVR